MVSMNKVILSNLAYRPIRSVISVTAVAVEVTLILVIVGLSMGILNDAKNRQAGIGADLMVKPPGSSMVGNLSSAPVSIRVAEVIARNPDVKAVAPVITQFNTSGAVEILYGIDIPSFEAVGSPFVYLEGGPFTGPDDILVDEYIASSKNLHVGDTMEALNHTFRICGIVANGKGARKFMPLKTVQELLGAENKASIFYVKLVDPAKTEQVIADLKQVPGMGSYGIQSMKEWLSLMTPDNIPGFSAFIKVVVGVAVCIGFIVIFQSMYTSVMERTREIGILKSMGASKTYVVRLILRESLMIAVAGILFGVALSELARYGIVSRFPTVRVMIEWGWILKATVIALAGAVLGALYPAYRAAQKDPIDALAYE
jgi:putative ABC transport system permease protein